MHYFSAKSCAIISNEQKPTNKLRKQEELVNTPDFPFNVQDIWEREEARNLCVYKRVRTIHSYRTRLIVCGLGFVTPFLCPF